MISVPEQLVCRVMSCSSLLRTVQRGVQEVLMQMFPFTAARLKADIQRAAFNDVGMHTPTHWQRVVVSAQPSSFP